MFINLPKEGLVGSNLIQMQKNLLVFSVLLFVGLNVHAQYIQYEPNPIPPQSTTVDYGRSTAPTLRPSTPPPSYEQPKETLETLSAYTINSAGDIKKYKIQVAVSGKKIVVASYKELSADYYTNLHPVNRPVAEKLMSYDELSEYFEYKVYVPSLGTTIYF